MGNNLDRFIKAQEEYYSLALKEIKEGYKQSHWMWFIYPQLKGLGQTEISNYYGIENIDEAKDYINNKYLYNNLLEISNAILEVENKNAIEILGFPDCYKLRSCMTLFYIVTNNEIFKKVIDKYYNGELDDLTINMLNK